MLHKTDLNLAITEQSIPSSRGSFSCDGKVVKVISNEVQIMPHILAFGNRISDY
jgi:hypothetical protein